METEKIANIVSRAYNVLSSLKNQNGADYCHTVGNMRNRATMLIEHLACSKQEFPEEQAERIIKNLESDLVDFFRKKYFDY